MNKSNRRGQDPGSATDSLCGLRCSSVPQFPHLENEDSDTDLPHMGAVRINELMSGLCSEMLCWEG